MSESAHIARSCLVRFWVLPEVRKRLDGFKLNSEIRVTLGNSRNAEIPNTFKGRERPEDLLTECQ